MAARHQPKSEKHPYLSPTTPGLYITFRDCIIELVCLNVNNKIGPRFWSDPKYWGPKYRREIRGVANLGKTLDLKDSLTQTALEYVIKRHNIKALVAKKTVEKVVRLTLGHIQLLTDQRTKLSLKKPQEKIDPKKNSTFVDTGKTNVLGKIRQAENG